ncbi:MAG TPA: single-stranded-DNA-specific exonuclease RecJ [Flavobacteriaceae bacterium]|nr:single-stranded-DNA-specific exonuclease RecJ [Flavobacteriaceae bacterium]
MRWTVKPEPNPTITNKLATDLGISTTLAKLLVLRGVENYNQAKTFFRPSLTQLHNPYLMKDMDKAVARIEKAISKGENILIYGDYDVDGTTAVSLVYSYLTSFYPNVSTYIPDRYDEGYGISYKGIDYAEDNNFTLIIALDCGIKAIDKVAYASTKNIDFVICDHHRPGKDIPKAVAVLDPKQNDCEYPYKELCGCGVGFKLIQALGERRDQTIKDLTSYLDLVAIAIAADIVPLTGENRALTFYGLKIINSNPRIGVKALLKQVKKPKLTITDVVFIIAPRINAAGRINHGNYAVELLTETNLEVAQKLAAAIENNNSERKQLDKSITNEALQQIEEANEQQNFATVVYSESWHKGVIGIVASRLIETYYKPTLVFTKSGEKLAASARSVKGFDVYNALEKCSAYIEQFGGHKYAAGLTITEDNFINLKNKFEEVVENSIPEELRTPEIRIDAELSLAEITPKFYRILKQFSPFGPQNMKPIFISSGVRDNGYGKCVGEDKTHLKLHLIEGTNPTTYNAIGFGLGNKFNLISSGKPFKIAYTLDENVWNGNTTIQLVIKDIQKE